MLRQLSALALTVLATTAHALGGERNYTMKGDGWFDANERFGRLPMREARLTVRDNGEFAVTLFVRNARYLVKGRWDRRGRADVERIDIRDAFGQRADGSGTLTYGRDRDQPVRLVLEGRTRDGAFHADITDDRANDRWDDRDRDRRDDRDIGRGDRLARDIDAQGNGDGTLRFSRERDGRLRTLRARLGTNRDVRLDFTGPARGTVRAEVTEIRGNRITARVREVYGVRAAGEVVLLLRDRDMVERVNGYGTSDDGSWQLDFEGRDRGDDWNRDDRDRRDDRWDLGMDREVRGSGWLRQDVGPDLSFDRMQVQRDGNDITIRLDGRRQSLTLRGVASGYGDELRVRIDRVNEVRARGDMVLRRDGSRPSSLRGDGRTDMGRFEVRFER